MAFFAAIAALAVFNLAAAFPHGVHSPCPAPLPVIEPVLVQSILPAAAVIGPQAPGVVEHVSCPYEINYFEKPWIIKHKQSAALNVFTQTPVVVDEYAPPAFSEVAAPPAVIVEEVCAAPVAPIVHAPHHAAPAPVVLAPALCAAPVVVAPAPRPCA